MLQDNGPQPVSVDAVEQWSLAPLSMDTTDSCPKLFFVHVTYCDPYSPL